MKYYRTKSGDKTIYIRNAKGKSEFFLKIDLLTKRELKTKFHLLERDIEKHFKTYELKSSKTFFFFGVRQEKKVAV